ncbi:endosome/lysosome-associated apoptosis and autophagy regulator family member 2 isoform X2 [Hydra vulgaris]|uniref:Endosome/lysosome-associated apoptosis and autophagy regulator family member 2 isoform X2 n=1 Tax=Hydra vulgaris TaxID=6087 RepID=A0ABM4DIS6_HYDVU
MQFLTTFISSFLVFYTSFIRAEILSLCSEKQMKYTYTTCDDKGNHWRVQVPLTNDCSLKTPLAPTIGLPCDFSCAPGQYLDIVTQSCLNCPEGLFSSGDTKRYSTWPSLPEGFSTRGSEGDDQSTEAGNKCADAVWSARDDYLESNGSYCKSILIYEVILSKPGNLTFTVRSGDESSFFHAYVKDSICATSYQYMSDQDKYISLSRDWETYSLRLQKGLNTVFFTAANYGSMYMEDSTGEQYETDSEKTVMIKDILVAGFPFSNECERCPPGTFSREGASFCESCEANTFSKGGAGVCEKCSEDKYSSPKSQECRIRKPCTENDFDEYWTQCENGKTNKVYKWLEPQICSSTISNAVPLPKPSEKVDCPPCNPGFYSNGTDCIVCPKNTYSNGREECKSCPPHTKGKPGLQFQFWNKLPLSGPIHLYCLSNPGYENGCRTPTGWSVYSSYISTGIGHSDDAELVMYIDVTAFTEDESTFTMTFEQFCQNDDLCRTKFQEVDAGHTVHDIQTFEGTLPKRTFAHNRHSRYGVKYRIVFEKKYNSDIQSFKSQMSRLMIYSIEITNVENGGTETCAPCVDGSDCINCKPGHYIESEKCIPCPENTYLPPSSTTTKLSLEMCQKCPDGLVSEPGSSSCYSNCLYNVSNEQSAQVYNFSELAGFHLVKGASQFTSKGYQFYHMYNISLCGRTRQESICIDNSTQTNSLESDFFVRGGVCRSTMVPDDGNSISAQVMSVGQSLLHIKPSLGEMNENVNKTTVSSKFGSLSFTFFSKRFTQICKNGTTSIVHLVCDPKESGTNAIQIGSSNCNTETCDGCKFEFTWKTMHACPKCSESDYEAIASGCENGMKKTRFVWKEPHVCVKSVEKPADVVTECSILEKSILDFKLAIVAFLFGAILLTILVVYLCCRNRSLSYKYNRLVDISMAKDGEFPESEKCALEVGEEDEEVTVSKGKSGSKFLKRIKGLRKKKDQQFSEFATINLDAENDSGDDDEI